MAQYRIDNQAYLSNSTTIFEAVMLADQNGNVINSFGDAANIPIAAGQVAGYSVVHKFGLVDGTASGALATIWSPADTASTLLYPWDFTPAPLTAVSSSANDTIAGSGTQVIRVEGLDADFNLITTDLDMNGTSATNPTAETFNRVFRAFSLTGDECDGTIDISAGGTLVAQLAPTYNQTLMSVYTVPAGKTAYLSNLRVSSAKQVSAIIRLMVRPFGGVFRAQSTISLYSGTGETQFITPLKITEKSDIDVRVTGGTNNTLSCDFDMILVDNPA